MGDDMLPQSGERRHALGDTNITKIFNTLKPVTDESGLFCVGGHGSASPRLCYGGGPFIHLMTPPSVSRIRPVNPTTAV